MYSILARCLIISFCFVLTQKTYANAIPPPSNDDCNTATALTLGVTKTSETVKSATSSGVSVGSCTGDPDDDVWYSFTLTSAQPITISLSSIGSNLSSSGARLQLFSGACNSLSSLSCGTTSISAGVLSAATYYVRVYSAGSTGLNSNADFDITVSGPPANDDCNGSITLTSGTTN